MIKSHNKSLAGFSIRAIVTVVSVLALAGSLSAKEMKLNRGFNKPGNIVIADQFNNRVIETDPAGNILWSFGLGPNDFSAQSILGVNDAQRVGKLTLMAGTGTAAGVIPQDPDGVPDNRVVLVDPKGKIVWQYGQFGQTGSGPNLLNTPVQSTFLPNFHILIADQGNNRAIEVTRNDQIVKTFTAGGTANIVAFASRLENGNTLLTDAGNSRAVEVDTNDVMVWQFVTNTDTNSVPDPLPTRAVRLKNGDTFISDQFNNRVIRVSSDGQVVASYGLPLAGGDPIGNNVGYDTHTTQNGYSPYDAKVVGDYTGLTPPHGKDNDNDD
jgi:hypothetical protein